MYGLSRLRIRGRQFMLAVCCPRCGTPLEPVTTGTVIAGTETSAIAKCPNCPREWQITVLLRTSAPKIPAVKRRGTRLVNN
jgi:uncharacterized Zn finger protein (UPF0148 family)